MAKSPGEAIDKTIKGLSDKAKFNKGVKSQLQYMEGGFTSIENAAKMDDTGLGRTYGQIFKPLRVEALRNAGIDYGKGTSLKQVENKGGVFSNLSPAEEQLMTRAKNAKMKLAASMAAKSKGKKK